MDLHHDDPARRLPVKELISAVSRAFEDPAVQEAFERWRHEQQSIRGQLRTEADKQVS